MLTEYRSPHFTQIKANFFLTKVLPSARGKLFKLFINFHPLIRRNYFPRIFPNQQQKTQRREMIAKENFFFSTRFIGIFLAKQGKKGYFMALVVTQIETGRKVFSYRHTARGHILNN